MGIRTVMKYLWPLTVGAGAMQNATWRCIMTLYKHDQYETV